MRPGFSRRRLLAGAGTIAAATFVTGCSFYDWPGHSFRFRWTIRVEVDGEEFVGASVFGWSYGFDVSDMRWNYVSPVINLSERGHLLALAAPPNGVDIGNNYLAPHALLYSTYWRDLKTCGDRRGPCAYEAQPGDQFKHWPNAPELLSLATRVEIPPGLKNPIFAYAPKTAMSESDLIFCLADDLGRRLPFAARYLGSILEPTEAGYDRMLPIDTPWWQELKRRKGRGLHDWDAGLFEKP
jgi:hypothetical protein